MKKSLLALAVLGAFAGVASAQSSVTLFGIVDLSINQIENGNAKTTSMQSNQLNSNRLGFRGVEDLGGGLSAGFHIEGSMSNQNGTAAGQTWQRKSTLSLISQRAGEIRLGRDYVPTFSNLAVFDVYGANGLGNDTNLISVSNPANSGAGTGVRANNSIAYFLPSNLGGLYGTVMYALGQGDDNNKYVGGRVGYAAGPFDVSIAYGETDTVFPESAEVMNIGASWNFGFLKLLGLWNEIQWGNLKETYWGIGVSVPMGQGELKAAYGDVNNKGVGQFGALTGVNTDPNDASIISIQYIYNVSKRTALYGGYAQLDNEGASARSILPGTIASGLAGNKSSGFNVGVRHTF